MKFVTAIFLIATMCVEPALAAPVTPASPAPLQAAQKKSDDLDRLWNQVAVPRLNRTPASAEEFYNFGELLMVPLHAAFRFKKADWQQAFADHFARLVQNPSVLPSVMLDRMQYLYLASEFVRLARNTGNLDVIPRGLPELLYSEVDSTWKSKPAWMWQRPAFHGARERVMWKLDNKRFEKGYYRVMFDDDMFLFAIAADMKVYSRGVNVLDWAPTLNDILAVSYRVFNQEVVWNSDGGWIFQPGVFSDHPEYKFAGNSEVRPGLQPAPVRNLSLDSSHSLRYPLWLNSQIDAYPEGSEQRAYYAKLKNGLNTQFFSKVVVPPDDHSPCYRMNNFLDGSNGVYRYNYASLGQGKGYGPYGLSSALLVGWWAFLETPQSRDLYQGLDKSFPWPHECIDLYLGPARDHPDALFDPDAPGMRMWHFLVELDARF